MIHWDNRDSDTLFKTDAHCNNKIHILHCGNIRSATEYRVAKLILKIKSTNFSNNNTDNMQYQNQNISRTVAWRRDSDFGSISCRVLRTLTSKTPEYAAMKLFLWSYRCVIPGQMVRNDPVVATDCGIYPCWTAVPRKQGGRDGPSQALWRRVLPSLALGRPDRNEELALSQSQTCVDTEMWESEWSVYEVILHGIMFYRCGIAIALLAWHDTISLSNEKYRGMIMKKVI